MQERESKTNWHFWISILKSCIRIAAGFTLMNGHIKVAGILLVSAEVLGILEEL